MMWNQNDTKYIIKRLILYIVISCIVFFGAQSCAKAITYTSDITYKSQVLVQEQTGTLGLIGSPSPNYNNEIVVNINQTASCDTEFCVITIPYSMSSTIAYDSNTYNISTNQEILSIYAITFGAQPNSSCSMNSGTIDCIVRNNTSLPKLEIFVMQNQINNNINITHGTSSLTYRIGGYSNIYSLQSSTAQAIIDQNTIINNQTTAINNQTSIIQQQNDFQQQNFQFDSSWSDSLDLFGSDTNYIRQLLLWPFTFCLVLGQSLSGNVCSAYTFGSLYGTQITLPCINWKNYVGNTIYTAIDIIMGMCILFGVITYIRKVFEYLFSFGGKAFETVGVEVFR